MLMFPSSPTENVDVIYMSMYALSSCTRCGVNWLHRRLGRDIKSVEPRGGGNEIMSIR